MARVYYQIELTARQLSVVAILGVAALLAAFVLGYGAGDATRTAVSGGPAPTPSVAPVAAPTPAAPAARRSPAPTVAPVATATAVPQPTSTPQPVPTATPAPTPTPTAAAHASAELGAGEFWVQVVAARTDASLAKARRRVADAGFPAEHQQVENARAAGGVLLHKLRVGPFPDRDSAERVRERMRASGFPDAWVVTP